MRPWLLPAAACLAAGCAGAAVGSRVESEARAQETIQGWPDAARLTARGVVEKYGPPDETQAESLVWRHRGRFKRIVVRAYGLGVVEQTLAYPIWSDKRRKLQEAFPDKIVFPGRSGELTALNESEGLNILTFNLADAVITDGMSPDEARAFYDRTVELATSGKESPYSKDLRFVPR